MKPETRENLETVLEHGALIQRFVAGLSFETYVEDARTRLAVERSFEIIGEALNRTARLDPELPKVLPDCRKIISFRNILAHGYDGIEDKLVWGIVEGALSDLLAQVSQILGGDQPTRVESSE